jgi:Tfp pilus assembly protein PilO
MNSHAEVKKNKISRYVSVMSDEKAYQISAWKALAIICGAVLVSVVGTAFTFISTASSDHFRLERTESRVDALETTTVKQDVIEARLEPIQQDITEIKADIKELLRQERDK